MKKFIILIVLIITLSQSIETNQNFSPPVWAQKWEQSFEDFQIIDDKQVYNQGSIYYNAELQQQRIVYHNAQNDILCRTESPIEEQCDKFINKGKMYLYFGFNQHCCMCCDVGQGCGMLEPDWMVNDNAEFQGVEAIDNQFYNVWKTFKDSKPVYSYYNKETGILSYVQQESFQELTIFDQSSYSNILSPSDVTNLPRRCTLDLECDNKCFEIRNKAHEIKK